MVAWDLSGVALAHLPYILQLLGFFLQSTLREACCCIWELLGMLGVNGTCCPTLSMPHPAQVAPPWPLCVMSSKPSKYSRPQSATVHATKAKFIYSPRQVMDSLSMFIQ